VREPGIGLVDTNRYPFAEHLGLLLKEREGSIAGTTIDADLAEGDQVSELAELPARDLDMELERRRIWMDRNDSHLTGLLVDVERVGDQLRLMRIDEVHQFAHPGSELIGPPFADLGTVDVNDCASVASLPVSRHGQLLLE
jgi:hypothetical protein